MTPISLKFKIFWIYIISYILNGYPVYVKDSEKEEVTVKMARPIFDPFTNNSKIVVKFRKYGLRQLNNDGTIGSSRSWQWQHVDPNKHAEHVLKYK